jgi:hypothetical protein
MDVGLNDVGQFRTGKTSGEQRAVGRMANGEWGVGNGEWGVGRVRGALVEVERGVVS